MRYKKHTGFTLIELMIVVAILGIIAAIAVPNYNASVRKARRADGTGALLDAANQLERCATVNGAYNHANCGAGSLPANSTEGYYAITLTAVTASTFTLSVAPQNAQAGDVADCPTMTLTNTGARTPSPDPNRCWGS